LQRRSALSQLEKKLKNVEARPAAEAALLLDAAIWDTPSEVVNEAVLADME
jgi:hypothetical protein